MMVVGLIGGELESGFLFFQLTNDIEPVEAEC